MDLLDGVNSEWQSFDDLEATSESVASVLSASLGKPESSDDGLNLPDVVPAVTFPATKQAWNTNEEVASILLAFDRHEQWMHRKLTIRPFSGSMFLYNRKDIKFRQDGYTWKTGKKGKLREDHMKLKINGISSIYGLYAHSSLLSTFHRRCYWLLARPNLILVHYLNFIPKDDAIKLSLGPMISLSNNQNSESSSSSTSMNRDTVLLQLCPMFGLPFPLQSSNFTGDESQTTMQQRFEKLVHLVDMALPVTCKSNGITNNNDSAMSARTTSARPILPKSSCDNSGYNSMECTLQQQSMPPPPPMAATQSTARTSQKRPLDPNSVMFVDDSSDQLHGGQSTTAYVIDSPQSYVFWNPSQLQSLQQPQTNYFAFSSQETSLSPRRVSCSNSSNTGEHGLLQTTFSAPSAIQQQPQQQQSSSMSFSGGDESNFFSSFGSSNEQHGDLFSQFDFSSSEVDELLQYSSSPLQSTSHVEQQQQQQTQQQQQVVLVSSQMRSQIDDPQPRQTFYSQPQMESPAIIRIKDIAPQYAFTRGGVKILIAGKWPATYHSISVLFGKTVVPATALQPGLLKCYCPGVNIPGAVDLVVCFDGVVRSNPCTFYYRRQISNEATGSNVGTPSRAITSASPGTSVNDSMIAKLHLLDLLQQLKDNLKPSVQFSFDSVLRSCSQHVGLQSLPPACSATELLAVTILAEITSDLPPPEFCTQTIPVDANHWTLMHFAAALGYSLLAEYLLDLRIQSRLPPVVEQQADVEARDISGCTPLHIACQKGHPTAAVTLFRRAPHLIAELNNDGLNPIGTAAAAGHYDVVRVMQAHEDSYLNHLESYPDRNMMTSMVAFTGERFGEESGDQDTIQPPTEWASQHMFDLANHIIAALPERIKQIPSPAYLQPIAPTIVAPLLSATANCSDAFVVYRERSSSYGSRQANTQQANSTPMGDSGLSTPLSFSFEAPDSNNSPQQQQQQSHPNHVSSGSGSSIRHRSPPPTPEQFNEYFNAPNFYLHHDFSHLTLSDDEQRKLYEAARVIQVAYRKYRESKVVSTATIAPPSRQSSTSGIPANRSTAIAPDQVLGILHAHARQVTQMNEQNEGLLMINATSNIASNSGNGNSLDQSTAGEERGVEVEQAALVIQAYYRRYKQFIAYRKMTEAATVIQSQFRSYSAQKRFRQSRDAARIIQNQYRMYRATNQRRGSCAPYRTNSNTCSVNRRRSGSTSSNSSISHGMMRAGGSGAIFLQNLGGPSDVNDPFPKMDIWNKSQGTSLPLPLHHPPQLVRQLQVGPSFPSRSTTQLDSNHQQQQQQQQHLSNLTSQSASSSQTTALPALSVSPVAQNSNDFHPSHHQ